MKEATALYKPNQLTLSHTHKHIMDDSTVAGRELNSFQLQKLQKVLCEPIEIRPSNNFPALNISPATLMKVVKKRLVEKSIKIRDIRMNGSAASHCLCNDQEGCSQIHFNDIDLIFGVSIERDSDFHVIKDEVLTSLLDFFPEGVTKKNISCLLLEETYVKKMVLVSNGDNKWSLISLGDQNTNNTSIELKFVSKIKRAFEFTVDSFQIQLDSYLDEEEDRDISSCKSVQAFSVYGNFEEALHHLNNRLIHTEAPEEIRGGGLLKYCTLLVNGFVPADGETMHRLEPYMCSRFFIDFPTNEAQYFKVHKYIMRFLQHGDIWKCVNFLNTLNIVVSTQAMCLMEPERQKTISVISHLRSMVLPPYSYHFIPPPPHHPITGIPNPHLSFRSFVPSHHYHYDPMRTSPPPHPHCWNSHITRPASTTKVR